MITSCSIGKFKWSDHAIERWLERFSSKDKASAFNGVVVAGKNVKRKIRKQTPVNAKKYMQGYNHRYYLINKRQRIVFVADARHDVIVTVFSLA